MKKCPKCGKISDTKYCTECGYDLSEVKTSICPSCGFETESKFCPSCGTPMPGTGEEPTQETAAEAAAEKQETDSGLAKPEIPSTSEIASKGKEILKKKSIRKTMSIIGSAGGAVSILLSLCVFAFSIGAGESSYTYGGDAYTGIQNAAAQTAVNIVHMSQILQYGIFAILFIAGVAMLCYFVPIASEEIKLEEIEKEKEVEVKEQ